MCACNKCRNNRHKCICADCANFDCSIEREKQMLERWIDYRENDKIEITAGDFVWQGVLKDTPRFTAGRWFFTFKQGLHLYFDEEAEISIRLLYRPAPVVWHNAEDYPVGQQVVTGSGTHWVVGINENGEKRFFMLNNMGRRHARLQNVKRSFAV